MHGNPWLRLLRREVEALVKKKHGDDYLKVQQAKTELAGINRKLKQMKTQVAVLEERKAKLMADGAPEKGNVRVNSRSPVSFNATLSRIAGSRAVVLPARRREREKALFIFIHPLLLHR